MTDEPDEGRRRVAAHIATMVTDGIRLGSAGDWNAALLTMWPLFYEYGPDEGYAWLRAMLRHIPIFDCGCGGPIQPSVARRNPDTGEIVYHDIDDPEVPSGVRTFARMMAANANDDEPSVRALWEAVVTNQDQEALQEVMQRALQYAIEGAKGATHREW